jgi:hypothetical protein
MTLDLIPSYIRDHYEIHERHHAIAILATDFPQEWEDICSVLHHFRLFKSHIIIGGGRKTQTASIIDNALYQRGWKEKNFDTAIVVDNEKIDSPTHAIDCYKNKIGLEIEWNNKDPFFDRDLNNFRLLFDLRVISVGVIITRCDELQDIFNTLGRGQSYGASTTHMSKLLPKINGGGGGGCPLLIFGIRKCLYDENN